MNAILLLAFLLALIVLGTYFLFAFIILFHIKKYGIDKQINKMTVAVFSLGIIAISFMMVGKFAAVDWDRIDLEAMMEDSNIYFFPTDYDRR